MAVVEVDVTELSRLVGEHLDRDTVVDELFELGVEYEGEGEDGLEFEVVPDRPDRLSVEGLARSLRLNRGVERGLRLPEVESSDVVVEVEAAVADVRPYVTGCVVRDVDLSGGVLDSLIQLQEKLHATLGRRRAKGAIGVHDLAMIKGERLRYGAGDPADEEFVPLAIGGAKPEEMTPAEVLDGHPVGREYAH
ncbi:MAG: phenylalanine--tRNA ligase subunit beta, partial [Halobacteriota archaeon]